MTTSAPDSVLLRRAEQLGAATLHEAATKVGALPSRLTPLDRSRRLAGLAFPLVVAPGSNLQLHRAIYHAAVGDVLVVDACGAREFGYFGEVMAVAAQQRGLAGLVIDAGVRDTRQIVELGFPVFAAAHCVRGTSKVADEVRPLGEPIVLGDVCVSRGGVVVGDADGVVVLPADRLADIVAEGERREAAETAIFERLRTGESTLDIYGLH